MESFFRLFTPECLFGVIEKGAHGITLQHLPPLDLKELELIKQTTYEKFFKFTIIRDPFDRMVSDYLWQKQHDAHNVFAEMSFDDYLNFAEQILINGYYYEKKHFDHFRPMVMYCFQDGELLVDDILLLENIEKDLSRIKDKIGLVNLPQTNTSSESCKELKTEFYKKWVYDDLYSADKELYDQIVTLQNSGLPSTVQFHSW